MNTCERLRKQSNLKSLRFHNLSRFRGALPTAPSPSGENYSPPDEWKSGSCPSASLLLQISRRCPHHHCSAASPDYRQPNPQHLATGCAPPAATWLSGRGPSRAARDVPHTLEAKRPPLAPVPQKSSQTARPRVCRRKFLRSPRPARLPTAAAVPATLEKPPAPA